MKTYQYFTAISMMTILMTVLAAEQHTEAPQTPLGCFIDISEGKASPSPTKDTEGYIERYKHIATQEMERTGIPASIKLAQAILESGSGTSRLATQANNHFGIKCFSRKCKKGHCMNYNDDSHKDFFRAYQSASESFRAHSEFLKKDRYKHLHQLPAAQWPDGLSKAGYATDPNYPQKLRGIIKKYDLEKYDSHH